MKVTGLLLVTLGLAAFAQATVKDYKLGCTEKEMGIRWPSYVSHSEYYVCPRIGGKQMIVSCKAGEVFTYVLQTCTKPSQYIPAPALELLPIDFGKLAGPKVSDAVPHPPIVSEVKPQVFEIPVMKPQQPPVLAGEAPKPPVEDHRHEHEHKHEFHHEADHIKTEEPKTEVHESVNSGKPSMSVVVPPMPPTPAPTPPVVEPAIAVLKPSKSLGNAKPTTVKQKSSGKNTSTKNGKKSVKNTKETSKTSPAKKSTAQKSPAKKSPAKTSTPKKSTSTVKKAPTKA